MHVQPGSPYPLGATWDGAGVNVAVYSGHASAVELCLFDPPPSETETTRVGLTHRTGDVWHAYLPDLRPGQVYGLRVHGPWDPSRGHRCNPNKLLIDPYARALTSRFEWNDAVFGHATIDGTPRVAGGQAMDTRDSAPFVCKAIVVDDAFDWGSDCAPRTPWSNTIIYECHVRGLTMRHPEVPEALRGTYLGLASEPVLEHLRSLGVTAVELMPVQHHLSEATLLRRGLRNYWGYNPIAFTAPHASYATGDQGEQVTEFKTMVKALHDADIEVILDVVYNHTAEGNRHGPTLSLRGIDNSAYYRLSPDDPRYYMDYTGCGNSLDTVDARGMQLVLDSLRTWVQTMHVDGFRFDLAPVLGRGPYGEHLDTFWNAMQQDPVLGQVKLIAEPWDLGHNGWRVGSFPVGWAEWNAPFRDTLRRFWSGDAGLVDELASRLAGSSDLYPAGPTASINFVACHDGFTLADLTCYDSKHNEDNGEDNRDGHDENHSRNWGVEGATDDDSILALRERIQRNLIATTVFSQGVTMLCAGDELGRTQRGNNNAYCQDNEIGWVDWALDERRTRLAGFTRAVLAIRREHAVLRRHSVFRGRGADGDSAPDVIWIRPDGQEMTVEEWQDKAGQVLGMLLPGEHADEQDELGQPVTGDTLLLLLNGGETDLDFTLPPGADSGRWCELVNTARPGDDAARAPGAGAGPRIETHGPPLTLPAHTLMLLRHLVEPPTA
jgi:glycogen operon protein